MRGAASRLTHAHRQPIRLSLAGKKLWARRHGSALRRVAVKGTPTDVFVLDFDGVLVDSEPEVSRSAYDAAKAYWPDVFAAAVDTTQQSVLSGLKKTRPVLIRGYESMVMARMLLEDPQCVDAILADWESVLNSTLSKWREDPQSLQTAFEHHRAGWLSSDRAGWLALNQPYPGVKDALQDCQFPVYIASSKAGHRVSTLLKEHFGLDIPQDSPRLFASLMPPDEMKADALREIAARPICMESWARLHFIDDRLQTLEAVQQQADLGKWNLYLADWGYNTDAERQEAAAIPGITTIPRHAFLELLKWGIAMGVDDGCEPTAEEVAAGLQ
eukprot:jgi/Chrzof1/8040/UNPLg00085.t1